MINNYLSEKIIRYLYLTYKEYKNLPFLFNLNILIASGNGGYENKLIKEYKNLPFLFNLNILIASGKGGNGICWETSKRNSSDLRFN